MMQLIKLIISVQVIKRGYKKAFELFFESYLYKKIKELIEKHYLLDYFLPGWWAEIDKWSVFPIFFYLLTMGYAYDTQKMMQTKVFFWSPSKKRFTCPGFGSELRCQIALNEAFYIRRCLTLMLIVHYFVMVHGLRFSRLFLARFHTLQTFSMILIIIRAMDLHYEAVRWKKEVGSHIFHYMGKLTDRMCGIWFFLYLIVAPHAIEAARYYFEYGVEKEMLEEKKRKKTQIAIKLP